MSKYFVVLLLVLGMAGSAHAVLINYDNGGGASATADFSLVSSNQLQIILSNTSTSNLGGGANQVLSSINFNLGDVNIVGGSLTLTAGSSIVENNSGTWMAQPVSSLNGEYGYSSTGVGNTGTGVVSGALDSVTSHSNGGQSVTNFNGVQGGVGGGLDYGLLSNTAEAFGNNRNFIQNSVTILLTLSGHLSDLSFLNAGSYVEFGSDVLFVPNSPFDPSTQPVVPEPATVGLVGLGLAFAGLMRRKTVHHDFEA